MLDSIIQTFEGHGRDAYDCEGITVDEDLFAGNRRIGIKATLPNRVAQDYDRMRVFLTIFFRREATTQDWFRCPYIEVMAGDEFATDKITVCVIAVIAALTASDSR